MRGALSRGSLKIPMRHVADMMFQSFISMLKYKRCKNNKRACKHVAVVYVKAEMGIGKVEIELCKMTGALPQPEVVNYDKTIT